MSFTSSPVDSRIEQCPPADTRGNSRHTSTRPRVAITGVWHWLLALLDQALVSGTRFLATIIVGRYCGTHELGTYSIAFSLLVLGGCFQEAIVTTPYAVLAQRLRRRSRATYAGAAARMHITAALGSAMLLLVVAIVGFLFQIQSLPTIALVLAFTLPCSLAIEFARRFALAELDVRSAAWLDAAVTVIQLVLLILLAQLKWLDARVALMAIGVAYVTPAILWWRLCGKLRMRVGAATTLYWRRNWTLGRWLLASQVMAVVHGYMPAWLLAVLVGTRATGEFIAYLNLALLANPLIFAVGSLLTPRAAHARSRGGLQAARQLVLRVLLYFVSLMALFALGLSVAGHTILQFIYGQSFVASEKVASLLGLTAIMWAISSTCSSGTIALGRPRWAFLASCAGSIVTAFSITVLAPTWTVYGATLGMLLGNATAAALHFWAFIRVSGGLTIEHFIALPTNFESRLSTHNLTTRD